MNTKYDLVDNIIDYENGELGDVKTLELFSHLIKTGKIYSLQGSYGRTARALIESEWLFADGNINKQKVEDNDL